MTILNFQLNYLNNKNILNNSGDLSSFHTNIFVLLYKTAVNKEFNKKNC